VSSLDCVRDENGGREKGGISCRASEFTEKPTPTLDYTRFPYADSLPLAGNPAAALKYYAHSADGRNIRIKPRGNAAVKERREGDNADSRVHSPRGLSFDVAFDVD